MSTVVLSPISLRRPRQRQDANAVLRSLANYCATLQPGDTVPTHTELMRQLDASERSVRWALDELRREGVIVRRNGAGTFISESNGKALAQATATRKSLIGQSTVVAIARPDHAVFDSAMNLLCGHVEHEGFELSCQFVKNTPPALPAQGEKPLGYVVFRRDFAEFARALQDAGHRVVLVGAPHRGESAGVPNVHGDHETGGALVIRHILEIGHQRLAFYGSDDVSETQRGKGHERALREFQKCGRMVTTQLLTLAEAASWQNRPELTHAYFSGPAAPTAVVAWNDHEAVALLGQLGRAGIRVPEDVSIVGYDNLREGQLVHPALSTVETALDQQLRAALDILTRETPVSPHHSVVVLPHFICRDSSALAAR